MHVLGRLNMSNMRLVTMKPPKMLMLEMKAAEAAKAWVVFVGNKPPPICSRPPTAVMPEMALVTDMSGE